MPVLPENRTLGVHHRLLNPFPPFTKVRQGSYILKVDAKVTNCHETSKFSYTFI